MIHQDLLNEAIEVACQVSGLPRLDKDALRRYPQLSEAIIVAYSNMRAARILINEDEPIVVVPDKKPEVVVPSEPPTPPQPEEIMVGPRGESITAGGKDEASGESITA